jgi:hypothetical protein
MNTEPVFKACAREAPEVLRTVEVVELWTEYAIPAVRAAGGCRRTTFCKKVAWLAGIEL